MLFHYFSAFLADFSAKTRSRSASGKRHPSLLLLPRLFTSIILASLMLTSTSAMANEKPVIISTPNTSVDEDSFYTYTMAANDADGDALTFSAPSLPDWLTFNSGTATVSGTPLNKDVGSQLVTLRVSDGVSSVEQVFTISVLNINDSPTVVSNIANLTLIEDIDFELDLTENFTDVDAGDVLIYSSVDLPGGLAVSPLGMITGAPTNDDAFDSPFNVTITATDLAKTSVSTFFQIIVVNINDAPTPADDIATLSEDSNVIVEVLKNDIDVDDVLLPSTVTIITQPLNGEASVNTTSGLITYTPNPDFAGTDSLEYRITDPLGVPGSAIVNFNILAVNDAPVAQNDVILTSEDTRIDIDVLINDTDPDEGDAPQGSQLVIESPPSNGVVEILNGLVRYTPNENFNGTDSLSYKAADLNGIFTNVATVTISVGAINDIPVAGDDIANTLEDTPVQFVVVNNDSDTEDGAIDVATIFIVNPPINGTAALNSDGTITYTPNLNYNGSDTMQYTVKDSKGFTSNAATVSITINPVNDAPVANNDLVELAEDTILEINVLGNDTDVDGFATIDVSSVNIVDNPSNGSLFIDTTNGAVRYSPNADFFGSDSFTYNIKDTGFLTSATATVLLTITSVNDAPRLVDDSANTDEDTPITINIIPNDNDVDGTLDLTTLTFTQEPAHGTVVFNSLGQVVFEPELNYHGNDLFSYTISDNNGLVSEAAASVLLTVNSINDAPIADDNALSVREDKTLEITLTGSDVDGDTLDFNITLQPRHGTLTGTGATRTYTPDENYNGNDNFNIQATDGFLSSQTANITIVVIPINDRPVATAQTVTVNEDATVTFVLTGSDIDNDPLTFGLAGGDLSGNITGTVPTVTYSPAENFNGEEKLLFFANDGELDSAIEVITINVLAVNDLPTVESQTLFLAEDSSIALTLKGHDIDEDILTYLIEDEPLHGTLTGAIPSLIYTPDENYFGKDSFTFRLNDGSVSSEPGTVTLNISPNSDVPVAFSQTVIGDEDTEFAITLTGTDPDGNNLSYQILTAPTQGTLNGTAPNLSYLPNPDYNGSDSISFKVSDGNFDSNTATVTISVTPINDQPTANDDVFSLSMAGKQWLTLNVLNNDVDPDNDQLTLLSAIADFGSVSIIDNNIRYAPPEGFAGDIFLSYLIEDPAGQSDTARVELTVEDNANAGDPQIEVPDDINVIASGRVTKVDLGAATAIDAQGNVIPVSLLSPNDNFRPGAHTVFWQATDAQGNSAIASQTVNVYPLVSLSKGQQAEEGDQVTVTAHLNGPAPIYPIVVPYSVEGDATAGIDYELADGAIRFEAGTTAELTFDTLTDQTDEAPEDIIIVIGDTPYRSDQSRHNVTLVEHNVAPRIMLFSGQNGQQRFLIEQVGGPVTIVADVDDVNSADTHTVQWLPGDGVIRGNQPTESDFVFSVQNMAPGVYHIAAHVTDSGEPQLSSQSQIFIEVVEILPELGNGDTDGDLIIDAIEGFADEDADHIPDFIDPISDCSVLPEQSDEPRKYLVEGETGGCLRRGSLTAGDQLAGILLDQQALEDHLPNDPDTTNVGGLFDFEVHNLRDNAAPYHLVIPQRQPIAEDAVYRKYSADKGWYTFVEDDNNKVWSAPGSAGICPPPRDNQWVEGLNVGHWCIQLSIEDGGENDNDGLVNHSIIDPGGVSVYNSSNNFPVAMPDEAQVKWNNSTTIEVLDNDSDEDNDSLVVISAIAQLGSVEIIEETQLSYEAPENYVGEDVIDYSISDGHGGIASSTVTIDVKGNSAPEANDDNASTTDRIAIIVDVLANDSDVDGDEISIFTASVNEGTVTITNDDQLQYSPEQDFEGTVTVVYIIEDPSGARDEGRLFVAVSNPAEPPPPPEPEPPAPSSDDSGGSVPPWLTLVLVGLIGFRRRAQ